MFLRITDVTEILGISHASLGRWRRDGEGPAFHKLPTGQVLYPKDDFYEWLDSYKRKSGA